MNPPGKSAIFLQYDYPEIHCSDCDGICCVSEESTRNFVVFCISPGCKNFYISYKYPVKVTSIILEPK